MIKINFTKHKFLNENSYKHMCKKKRRIQAASQKVIHKSKPVLGLRQLQATCRYLPWIESFTGNSEHPREDAGNQAPGLRSLPTWESKWLLKMCIANLWQNRTPVFIFTGGSSGVRGSLYFCFLML